MTYLTYSWQFVWLLLLLRIVVGMKNCWTVFFCSAWNGGSAEYINYWLYRQTIWTAVDDSLSAFINAHFHNHNNVLIFIEFYFAGIKLVEYMQLNQTVVQNSIFHSSFCFISIFYVSSEPPQSGKKVHFGSLRYVK